MIRALIPIVLLAAAPAAAETLVVGNKGDDTVSFVDLTTGRERARLATGRMPHEVAISPDGRHAAVVAYGGTTIDIFDVRRAVRLRTIDLAPQARPHGLAWLRDGRLVVTAEGSRSLAVIRPDGAVTAIPTGAGSHMVAVSADGRRAYVANMRAGSVGVLDLARGVRLRDIAVGGTAEGIALARDGRELWIGDNDGARVRIVSTSSFRPLGTVAVGPTPIRIAVAPDGRTAVTSNNGDGTLSLIDVATRQVRRTIDLGGGKGAEQVTILFSRDGRRLFVAETGPDRVAEVDLATGRVRRRLAVGRDGDGLGIAP